MSERLPKFHQLAAQTLFGHLLESEKSTLIQLDQTYHFTQQELRQLVEILIDFRMWQLPLIWPPHPSLLLNRPQLKKEWLLQIHQQWHAAKARPNSYDPNTPQSTRPLTPKKRASVESGQKIFGLCPVASEQTVCCNLRTIDVVQNCGFGCHYCSIQTFYEQDQILFETNLKDKLAQIPAELRPDRLYHFGIGQSTDSLMWGNEQGLLTELVEFARAHPNLLLELKTKSANIEPLLKLGTHRPLPRNLFCSWSLNPQTVITHEEPLTASLTARLAAARQCADHKVGVAFHLHPIIFYEQWEADYTNLANQVMNLFHPQELLFLSLGTLTFIRPAIKRIRQRAQNSQVLKMPLEEVCGRHSYSRAQKQMLFSHVYKAFSPWHEALFFYLCMEPRPFWLSTFGRCYESNEQFEAALCRAITKSFLPESAPHMGKD